MRMSATRRERWDEFNLSHSKHKLNIACLTGTQFALVTCVKEPELLWYIRLHIIFDQTVVTGSYITNGCFIPIISVCHLG